jgi:PPR repeat
MLFRYQEAGQLQKALDLFSQMDKIGVVQNVLTFITLFLLCGKLQDGQLAVKLYSRFQSNGFLHGEYSASAAISMFSKCKQLEKARNISGFNVVISFDFDSLNVFTDVCNQGKYLSVFNAMISAYPPNDY